jgi:hypothetical protein
MIFKWWAMPTPRLLLTFGPDWVALKKAFEKLYQYPLRQSVIAKLNQELRFGVGDEALTSNSR